MNRRQFVLTCAALPFFVNKLSTQDKSKSVYPSVSGGPSVNVLDSMARGLHARESSLPLKDTGRGPVNVAVSYGGTSTVKLADIGKMPCGEKKMCVPAIGGPFRLSLHGMDYPVPIESVLVAGPNIYLNFSTASLVTPFHYEMGLQQLKSWEISGTSARVRVELGDNGNRMSIFIGFDGLSPLFEQSFVKVPDSSLILWVPTDSHQFPTSHPEKLQDFISVQVSLPHAPVPSAPDPYRFPSPPQKKPK